MRSRDYDREGHNCNGLGDDEREHGLRLSARTGFANDDRMGSGDAVADGVGRQKDELGEVGSINAAIESKSRPIGVTFVFEAGGGCCCCGAG
ncbi:hypothetical protein Dda_2646 [Drechslerella dactyloides]|uniref:Uncharacterized protein n=1 Tax=Drechslerella dactyloides TaxID=74499 RepID=A0AAD6NKS0_DREDA|nr:hypothetical protein Dda_2646 [Drechslerella dactyloides]